MGYSQHMLARVEHERMVKSVPHISEFGEHLAQPERHVRLPRLSQVWVIVAALLHIAIK
jgi:hypothetical protein